MNKNKESSAFMRKEMQMIGDGKTNCEYGAMCPHYDKVYCPVRYMECEDRNRRVSQDVLKFEALQRRLQEDEENFGVGGCDIGPIRRIFNQTLDLRVEHGERAIA